MSSEEMDPTESEVWRRVALIIFVFLTVVVASGVLLVIFRDLF